MKGQRRARHGCREEDVYVFVGSRKQLIHIDVSRRVLSFGIETDNLMFEKKLGDKQTSSSPIGNRFSQGQIYFFSS